MEQTYTPTAAGPLACLNDLPEYPVTDAEYTAALLFDLLGNEIVEIREVQTAKKESWRVDRQGFFERVEDLRKRKLCAYATFNRLAHDPGKAACDADISRIKGLFIDLDPVREAKMATPEHTAAAIDRAKEIEAYLVARGWPEPWTACSGNGAYLFFQTDLDPADRGAVERLLKALSGRFSDEAAAVDPVVHNPSRIMRIIGTTNHKNRPEAGRETYWEATPDALPPVTLDMIHDVTADCRGNLAGLDLDRRPTLAESGAAGHDIPEGQRNGQLFREACKLRLDNWNEPVILAAMLARNSELSSPVSDSEVQKIVTSAMRYDPAADPEPDPLPAPAEAPPLGEHLLNPGGLLSEIIDHTMETAAYPNRPLAFAGALVLLSVLVGRQVYTPGLLAPVFYLIALAGSGVGKEAPRQTCRRVLSDLHIDGMVLNQIGSAQGLEEAIAKKPVRLALTDEIAYQLGAMRADSMTGTLNLQRPLLELHTASTDAYWTRTLKDQDAKKVFAPCLVCMGSAPAGGFWSVIDRPMLERGLMARTLVIEGDKRGPRQLVRDVPLPRSIIKACEVWAPEIRSASGEINPHRKRTQYDDAGLAIMEAARDAFDHEYQLAEKEGDEGARSVWARAGEHAERLALLHALSHNPTASTIGPQAAIWGHEFADAHARRFLSQAKLHIHETPFQRSVQAFLDMAARAGGEILHRDARHKTGHGKKEFDEIIEHAVSSGRLSVEKRGRGQWYIVR